MLAHIDAVLYRAFHFNTCVTVNELRMRLRGIRPFMVMLFYAAIASAAALLALLSLTWSSRAMYGPRAVEFGRTTFMVLAHTQLTLILLILPAYGAGAIAMEREKRTFEMLRAALVTSADVVTGKLLAILGFGLVLLLTSLPVAAWCLLLGGLAPDELLCAYLHLSVTAAFAASLGLAYSARSRRSIGAVVATYGTLIAFSVLAAAVPAILMIPTAGGRLRGVFGAYGASGVLLALGLLAAWMLFVASKWLAVRLLGEHRKALAGLFSACLVVACAACLYAPVSGFHSVLQKAPVTWAMVMNPYVGLTAVMNDSFAREVTQGFGGAGGVRATLLQVTVLQIAGGITALLAASLWMVSVRCLRARE